MSASQQEWESLRKTWEDYHNTVAVWLEVSADPEADPDLVDGLIHQLMAEHKQWSEVLGKLLHATHHH